MKNLIKKIPLLLDENRKDTLISIRELVDKMRNGESQVSRVLYHGMEDLYLDEYMAQKE